MSGDAVCSSRHPEILWAQRPNCVYLTVALSDVKDEEIDFKSESFHFKGRVDSPTPTNYELKFDFYAEVDPKKAVRQIGDRVITYCVEKKESSVWPRLLKDSSKQPWLKTDFSRWKDLDDSDSDGEGGFGGFGGAGGNFQDMLSMMGNKDLGEEEEEEEDSDDDELPDLEDPAKPKAEESEIPVLLGLCAVCLCINYCTSSHRLVS
ncbi:Co-chaperone protein daf-41 [Echinococcus granulosus]|nr:Co-chaperone protein daf-41 [Echinococcus granulosus]